MEEKKNLFWDLDDLQYRMHCGVDILYAVHECMESGTSNAKDYTDALFGACLYMESISKEIESLVHTD